MRIIYPGTNGINPIIDIASNNIHINDSYMIPKKSFKEILKYINNVNQNDVLKYRSISSLCLEWAVHNFLYNIGYQKDRTKDVDLDYPQTTKYKIGYGVVGVLVWMFVK